MKRYTQQVIQADTADAAPLNSSVMQNREVQNPKTKPGLDDSKVLGYLVSWVVLLGGYFSGWVLKQAKDGGNFILSVSSGWLYFQVSF